MKEIVKNSFIAVFILALISASAIAQVRVSAQVDSSTDIYVGQDFGYYIFIEGSNTAGQPDLSVLQQYNPRFSGNRQQSSTQIINNRVTTTSYIVMMYLLSAKNAGRIQLPPVTVTLDGKTYQTNAVQVNILQPDQTDQLDLEVTLLERRCYVGQPVILTVKFYIMADIGDFQFNIPAFNEALFYLEEPDITDPRAREYDLGNGIPVRVSQIRTTYNGKEAILLSFSKVLIPKEAGEIEIEPSSVSAEVAVGRVRPGNSFFSDFFSTQQYRRFIVESQPLRLNVLALPNENKPAGFYGLVGRYTISASATPTSVSVGDPITLNINIGGSKYLKPVLWPDLEKIPKLAENFKIPSQRASPIVQDDSKVFTQTIRANNDEVTEIPPIPLVFFDPEKGEYITAKTEPIKLEVSPSKILTNADLEGMEFEPLGKEVEAVREGLSANYEDFDALENQTFSPIAALIQPVYLMIWSVPFSALILSFIAKFFTHTTPEKIAQKRRRAAAGKAIEQLRKIAHSAQAKHEELTLIMKQYIGERFDKTAGALTSNECYEIIYEVTKDMPSANRYKEIIADCEAARYASAEGGLEQQRIEEVIDLIRNIEKKSK